MKKKTTKKKTGLMPAAGVIIVAIILISAMGRGDGEVSFFDRLFNRESIKTTELAAYVQDLTGVQTDDVCIDESGEVRISSSEEYAYICLTLSKGGAETLAGRLTDAGYKPFTGNFTLPGYEGHELAQKLAAEEIDQIFMMTTGGKGGAKTRSIEIYISHDEEGNEYLYLFG